MSAQKLMLSIVVPVFNEERHIGEVVATIRGQLERLDYPFELIFVDDGSEDATWSLLSVCAQEDARIRGIRLSRNFGKEAALAAGLSHARGDAVITMDGDLQHPPDLIQLMVGMWRKDQADVVEAVKRRANRDGLIKKIGSWLFYFLVARLCRLPLANGTDFKLLDRKVVRAWQQIGERNLFFRGICHWLGFRHQTLMFDVPDRVGGSSKWSLLMSLRLALTGITAYSSFPLQFTTLLGGIFTVFALLLGAQTLYIKFSGQAVSGFTTVILLLLIIGSAVLIFLGIIGAYLARIFEEVKGRPRYLTSHHLGFEKEEKQTYEKCC